MLISTLTILATLVLSFVGIFILFSTTFLAIITYAKSEWDEHTTQGTIILTSMGISMIFIGSVLLTNSIH